MWRIELFGEPKLVGYGLVINRFESKRAVALLAYLALHSETRHPREVLADRIWPDAPLDSARNRLKQALASLRRIMEPPSVPVGSVLDADRASIGLRPGAFTCDVEEFRQFVKAGDFSAAAELKKGELLPGIYDDWLEDIRLELSAYEYDLEMASPAQHREVVPKQTRQRIHIPAAVSSFVGREEECQRIADALSRSRMVTVTGFGGIGKTRTTQQVGRLWSGGDVFFVPLVGLNSVEQVPYTILSSIGAEPHLGDPIGAIQALLKNEPNLLILDNAETLPGHELGELLVQLLECCPDLRLLISSRIPLRCPSEAVFALSPLSMPTAGIDLESLVEYESVRLFVDRARNARPDFQVTANNAGTIASICGKLEGNPLAIELCAAWSRLGTSAMLSKLDQGQAMLSARKGATSDRHGSTLRVFESTCDLLSTEAARLLGQLSLFRSGFELPLLDAFCSPPPSPEELTELIEASLVVPVYDSEPERFFLLESVRQHAEGLLTEAGTADCNQRFVEVFAQLSVQAQNSTPNPTFGISDQSDWVRFLQRNWDCFHHAAHLAGQSFANHVETIVFGTEWFWSLYVPNKEIVKTLEGIDTLNTKLLELTYLRANDPEEVLLQQYGEILDIAVNRKDLPLQAGVLLRMAKLKVMRQHMDGVEQLALRAATVFRDLGDILNLGQALHILYNAAIQLGNRDAAEIHMAEAEHCFRACGNQVNLAALVYTQCREHYIQKEYEQALVALYRCRDVAASLGNMRFMGRTANLFGVVLRHLGDEARARVYLYLSLLASLRVRDSRGSHIPMWNLFLSLGKDMLFESGVVIMGYAMKTYHTFFGSDLDPEDEDLLNEFNLRAKEALGPIRVAALEAEGRGLSLEQLELQLRTFLAAEIADHQSEIKAFLNQDRRV